MTVEWEGRVLLEQKRNLISISGYWRRSVSRVGVVVALVLGWGRDQCHGSATCRCILMNIAKGVGKLGCDVVRADEM